MLLNAISIEMKKRAAYVASFWLKMIVPPAAQIFVAYFLWSAIYQTQNVTEIGGINFSQMIFYYVLVSCVYQMTRPDMGMILREIYEGSLTKFLVYPTSFFGFKFAAHLAHMILVLLQLVVAVGLYLFFFELENPIVASNLALGLVALIIAGFLFFIMMACLELLSFWFESAWALCIMLDFVIGLMGGRILPLELFPSWLKILNEYLPFRYLVSFPVEVIQGTLSQNQLVFGFGVSIIWCFMITLLAHTIWNRGSYQYTGTGM